MQKFNGKRCGLRTGAINYPGRLGLGLLAGRPNAAVRQQVLYLGAIGDRQYQESPRLRTGRPFKRLISLAMICFVGTG